MKLPDTLEVRCAGSAGRGIFAVAWQLTWSPLRFGVIKTLGMIGDPLNQV